MIRFERVTYSYPQTKRPALRDVQLQIDEGSWVAVLGANGAGKSTFCAAVAGFIPHHFRGELYGRVLVNRTDTAATPLSELVTQVGLVFQNPLNQFSGAKLTVAEEAAFGLENLGVPREAMIRRVEAALEWMGLQTVADRSPYTLSGGEQQRLALACILVLEPRILVLDEPTSQLDSAGTREVYDSLRSLLASRHLTVILVEHKTEWIAQYADRVLVLNEGAVVLDGSPREVLAHADLSRLGVNPTRYTIAARAARDLGIWPSDRGLPVALQEAVEGFRLLQEPEGIRP